MTNAVIVSTAIANREAYRGAFNATTLQALSAHAISHAGKWGRSRRDQRLYYGSCATAGAQGGNIARQAAIRAGLPVTVGGMSLDRQCASGMMAIATRLSKS